MRAVRGPTSGPPEVTEPEAVAYTSDVTEAPPTEETADPTLPDQPVYVVTD